MYTYKVIDIEYSMWTGKEKQNVEDTINGFAQQGWRLVQVVNSSSGSGSIPSLKLFLEKKTTDTFSDHKKYDEEDLI